MTDTTIIERPAGYFCPEVLQGFNDRLSKSKRERPVPGGEVDFQTLFEEWRVLNDAAAAVTDCDTISDALVGGVCEIERKVAAIPSSDLEDLLVKVEMFDFSFRPVERLDGAPEEYVDDGLLRSILDDALRLLRARHSRNSEAGAGQ